MSDQQEQDDLPGSHGQPQQRAGKDEGVRAPFQTEKGPIQSSVFDGAGNEAVVVTTEDAEGNRKQGTGDTAEEALKDAQDLKDPKEPIGEGFYPEPNIVEEVKEIWKGSPKK